MIPFTNEDADDEGLFFAKKSHPYRISVKIVERIVPEMRN